MKKHIVLIWILTALLFSNCEDEKQIDITGSIVGYVKLYNENGVELADKSNVKVSLNETTSTLSDATGRFDFSNTKAGTYQILFEKEGFGYFKKFNFIFVGGNAPGVITDVPLLALPSFQVSSPTAQIVNNNSVKISMNTSEIESYLIYYYFSDQATVSFENYTQASGYSFCCGPITSIENYLPLPLGSPLYIIAYASSPGNINGTFGYYDPELKKSINPFQKKLFDPIKLR